MTIDQTSYSVWRAKIWTIPLPSRSRSHQVEDRSINIFEGALPQEWVCRRKDKDYGIDLEVEIFDQDGSATGLMFFVQVKATDDPKKLSKKQIEIDRLTYLNSFMTPALIIRCCVPTKELRWLWAAEALKSATPGVENVTINFDRPWSDQAHLDVGATLSRVRRLRDLDDHEPIVLKVSHGASMVQRMEAENAVEELVASCRSFRRVQGLNGKLLELMLDVGEATITIAFDRTAALIVGHTSGDSRSLKSAIFYGLIAACRNLGMLNRASAIAYICLGKELSTEHTELALQACMAATQEPEDIADIAILNDLHMYLGSHHQIILQLILACQSNPFNIRNAAMMFLDEAESAVADGKELGKILYARGNTLGKIGDHRAALAALNDAKRADPTLWNETFFVDDLAASLFFLNRFRFAAKLYKLRFDDVPSLHGQLRYADALLFAGDFHTASNCFRQLSITENELQQAEARLKLGIADWFIACAKDAPRIQTPDLKACAETLRLERRADAVYPLLAAAFLSRKTIDWADCIAAAAHDAIARDVLTCATFCAGAEPFYQFRGYLAHTFDERTIGALDGMFIE